MLRLFLRRDEGIAPYAPLQRDNNTANRPYLTPAHEKDAENPTNPPHKSRFLQHLPVDKTHSLCYILITKLEVFLLAKALEYKGHPLQRKDNIIYYGSFADKYIIMMQVLDSKKEGDLDVATKVSVQLQMTDPSIKSRDRVVKKSEKDSLYAAMDVAAVWLERALSSR